MTWLRQLVEAEGEQDPAEFLESLKVDLFEDEVFVFTPKGEVKSLSGGSTPLDFAYAVHTDVGHRCVGAKVNGNIVPLHYQLRSGDIVEVLTAKQKRGPSRDWLKLVRTSRARNKIRAFFKEERREDAERSGREKLEEALRTRGLPMQKVAGSPLLADVIREMGHHKASEFYIALGQGKISTKTVANKIMQRLKAGEAVEEQEPLPGRERGEDKARRTKDAATYGISVKGAHNVAVRLAKCCRPVPGDEIAGYVSLGRGITIHRTDCKNVHALMRDPERFVDVELGRRERILLPGRDPDRRLRPHPPARGPLADLLGGGDQHHRRQLHDQPPDGQEQVRGRGRRHRAAQELHLPPAQRRVGVRRLPDHAGRLGARP